MMKYIVLAFGILVIFSAIDARAQKIKNIRQVDFKNFSYSGCGEDPHLTNGHQQYGDSQFDVNDLKAVKYLDFDGDGKEEAFVTIEWSTSGSAGGGMDAYVYTFRNGSATPLWSKCNERSTFRVSGKSIIYVYPEYVGNDAHCCPSYITTDTYAWRNGRITRISKTRKRTPRN